MTNAAVAGAAVAVIGGGPAGLMAAEVLSAAGARVTVYERMPSVGRKFLMAGRGGLNLTHSEGFEELVAKYSSSGIRLADPFAGDVTPEARHRPTRDDFDAWGRQIKKSIESQKTKAAAFLQPILEAFTPKALVEWANRLGEETFVGTSGRIFPKNMKASPLMRAWLGRLSAQGVAIRTRMEWLGWSDDGRLRFENGSNEERVATDAVVLGLGGGSWPKLGSNGAWQEILRSRGIDLEPLRSANTGFSVAWQDEFREKFAGQPIKSAGFTLSAKFGPTPSNNRELPQLDLRGGTTLFGKGDFVVTRYGVEGGPIYDFTGTSGRSADWTVTMLVDLRPDMDERSLRTRVELAAPGQSTANILRKAIKLSPVAINLMREGHGKNLPRDPAALARAIKAVPLNVTGVQGLERAISSAGGVRLDQVDEHLMLTALPGTFVAGEMLDWSAPTGGYLLQACFATGAAAANGALAWLARRQI